jgi:CheY-like chemotaxis protein
LTVTDNGEGISGDFLPFVFDRFRQAEGGSRRVHAGLGLGLSIVRELVELHNGSIRAHSEGEGKGATFIVRLPCGGSDETSTLARAEPMPSVSLAGIKVLIVDDETDSREMTAELLADHEARGIQARSAQEALAAFKTYKPDVLVSDIGMPFEDGYDLFRKVRALDPEEGGRIPACALIGWGATREAEQALASGFQAHISKPAESERLAATVYRLAKGLPLVT